MREFDSFCVHTVIQYRPWLISACARRCTPYLQGGSFKKFIKSRRMLFTGESASTDKSGHPPPEPYGESGSAAEFVYPESGNTHEANFSGSNRTPICPTGTTVSGAEDFQKNQGVTDQENLLTAEREAFPSWSSEANVPLTYTEITQILYRLQALFRFQEDSARNVLEYFMALLDSRALRMGLFMALRSLHGDYIGGQNSNYRKWYFATEMDTQDPVRVFDRGRHWPRESKKERLLRCSHEQWNQKMARLSSEDYATQVLLYLLVWGEANNLRFMPECICFIYQCCIDHFYGAQDSQAPVEKPFLDHIITPIYMTLRLQSYYIAEEKLTHVDRDHSSIIGYDDMNLLFWHKKGIMKIKVSAEQGGELILSIQRHERYQALGFVLWDRVFLKTYKERRTWMHVVVSFNRVFSIHIALFWVFSAYHSYPLYTADYDSDFDNVPAGHLRLSAMSLAGALLSIFSIVALIFEVTFVPRRWPGAYPIFWRLCALIIVLGMNIAPTTIIYISGYTDHGDKTGLGLAAAQFIIGSLTSIYIIFASPIKAFGRELKGRSRLAAKHFTADFHPLSDSGKIISKFLWLGVFTSKFLESFYFLSAPLKDPVRELSAMQTQCLGDGWIGPWLCLVQPLIVLVLIFLLEFVLFLLDTYLWYVVWNTLFSVAKLLCMGTSIWTPWRNIYTNLPKRIYSKLLVPTNHHKLRRQSMVARIWNLVIVAMYRDHFLSIEQVQKLLYDNISGGSGMEPPFFVSQEDSARNLTFFGRDSEAQRRIAFFAQALTLSMPDAREIGALPSFSVLVPHFSEKIILLLKEIVQEEDKHTHVTLLEYLKLLYPAEWKNFVLDTMMMAQEDSESGMPEKDDPLIQAVGFKDATPVYIMRTRVWALLRTQTLYRTVFGFMNYLRAIKMFYDLESSEDETTLTTEDRLKQIHQQTCKKFRIVIAMQRYKYFTTEELACVDVLLSGHPELQIAYIDEAVDESKQEVAYYLCLIDGTCPKGKKGREPRFRIRLSGYPILGDGKADNQNHALIFTRGEYLQLVDANQDNYIEECLKIRNVLAEFEELSLQDPYDKTSMIKNPVAIVGTREYIFSENTGILGDISAGKEQTFGTLFARTLAEIGGKLHYGHPDFLNTVFMTTRGGVSKAQKGLHLNEDIYAGMTALIRGGRIKHCEYMQCGKGRDLGFTSILNFITKIGAGMGEQILSREYFFLGTQLPLDRLLSFYYAHLGFHLNNYFIIFSIQLFLLTGINIAALTKESIVCEYDELQPANLVRNPPNCRNLIPVVNWFENTVRSILFVFLLSLLPLAVHELTERGLYKAITRTSKHILSLLPFFEVFVCRIYAQALGSDLAVGGAQYIATGRGFATKREKFADLYTRFGHELLCFGTFMLLLVIYLSLSIWLYSFIFFWITISGFALAPFLFNPGQFSAKKFLVDYVLFVQWLYLGNRSHTSKTWIEYTKIERSRLTGVKLALVYGNERLKHTNFVRPSRWNVLFLMIVPKVVTCAIIACAYLFANSQNETTTELPSFAVARITLVASLPLLFNLGLMIVVFMFNITVGWFISSVLNIYPSVLAFICRTLSLLVHFSSFVILWQLQNCNFAQTVLGCALVCILQKVVLQTSTVMFLSREVMDQRPNHAWWSGKWLKAGLGWRTLTQPLREFVCKVAEQTNFATDFTIGHLIFFVQIPFLLIPFGNTWHSVMLMWIKPTNQMRQLPPYSDISKRRVAFSAMAFGAAVLIFAVLVIAVVMLPRYQRYLLVPRILRPLLQPASSNDGESRGLRPDLYVKLGNPNRDLINYAPQ